MTSQPSGNPGGPPRPLISEYAQDMEMAELVDFFLSELEVRMKAMREASESGDNARLRDLAHQIQGAAGGYGFPGITSLAAELESTLKAQEAEASDIAEKTEALIALCRRATGGN